VRSGFVPHRLLFIDLSIAMDKTVDLTRLQRIKLRSFAKRDSYAAHIRSLYDLAQQAKFNSDVAPQLVVAGSKLDMYWTNFRVEDEAFLEVLCDLDQLSEYSSDFSVEISGLVDFTKAVIAQYEEDKKNAIVDAMRDTSALHDSLRSGDFRRLPEIPLPHFNGDIHQWPAFRDRFDALVAQRSTLTNIEKFYYLVGCLQGSAVDIIRGIPVSGSTYELAWAALVARFDKPRLVASALIDKLLQAPISTSEGLMELNKFLTLFDEGVSVLKSLKIPDLGNFILFSLAARCLPASCRTLFESQLSTDFPSIEDLLLFVKSRATVLERVQGVPCPPIASVAKLKQRVHVVQTSIRTPSNTPHTSLVSTTLKNSLNSSCLYCQNSHTIDVCRKFGSLSADERNKWAFAQRICFSCFGNDHWANRCKTHTKCSICSRRHHTLLHPSTTDTVPASSSTPPVSSASLLSGHDSPSVMLGTALVHIRDRSGVYQSARALVDSASQISAITVACAKRLGLRWSRWTAPITGLSGVPVVEVQGRVECRIVPRFASEPVLLVQAWVLSSITGDLPRCPLEPSVKDKYSNLALADPNFHITSPIELLLGADLFPSVMSGRQVVIDQALPTAFSSCFGWILIGPIAPVKESDSQPAVVSLLISVESLVDRFWHIEEPEAAPLEFTDAGQCESIFRENFSRDTSGRFSVPLPFRIQMRDDLFTGSRAVAIKRFDRLERKLSSDDQLRAQYNAFMAEYADLGHMTVATSPGRYFIPHHAVINGSDKIRVVFDASAQCPDGSSLNKLLFSGPKLQQEIIDVLTRFRLFRHAFTADVCKMYRQIMVLPEFRAFQHIFWRPSPHEELIEYELNTVTYGVNCAPFLALRVLQEIADVDCVDLPRAQSALRYQTYVDDICYGADHVDEALAAQADLNFALAGAGLELRKWASNTDAVLQTIPNEFRVSKSVTFADDASGDTKVLGLFWQTGGDYFTCEPRLESPIVFTKRGILSLTARFFDPLGLFAPAIFLAKHIMQRTWQAACTWDSPLPLDIHQEWAQFVEELPTLSSVRVPRYFHTTAGSTCSLYGFCDASQRGYAAVVFLRVHDIPKESAITLIGTKTKLAPITRLTVPRLELNAAVLLARWMRRIHSLLSTHVNIIDTHAWTDSRVVLSWLTISHEAFKQYVSNRVHQIQTLLPSCQWRYVKSEENPADCASRGLMPSALPQHKLYWHGPSFLLTPPHQWGSDVERLSYSDLPEGKFVAPVVCVSEATPEWFTRFSSYDNLIRVVSRILRFVARCRRIHVDPNHVLTRDELDAARRVVVLASQRSTFDTLFGDLKRGNRIRSRPLARLSPFIDSDGVIRVGGRLRRSALPYDSKHPILLSKTSYLSLLVCRHWHKVTCHSGPRLMTALISRQFWIVSMRSVIYSVITKCTHCVRIRALNPHPRMADLPDARVHQCRPFSRVGIDYAGPIVVREHRLRKSRTYKTYIAVFVCLGVKAVHLELVTDLSTEAFLAAFERFAARRGLPTDIYSDCGTNFVGANRQLRQLVNCDASQPIITAAVSSCNWHFSPPSAPHFGGLWEAAVRSAKRLLTNIVGVHILTYEEFTTVLCRIEAVLNSRPLTPLSTDPHDLESLTPGHFLVGQPLLTIPPRTIDAPTRSIRDRWKLLEQCHQAFWRRWSTEYLQTLHERTKWTDTQPNVQLNTMVTIRDTTAPPLEWRLGRVIELLPGLDGVVRVVRVRTSRGIVTRPVSKIVVLPTQ